MKYLFVKYFVPFFPCPPWHKMKGGGSFVSWKKSFQLAFIYVGTIVGAGFATGKEIVEFFSQYGFMGLIGICISGLCFIGFGVKIMLLAIELQARSFQQLNVHIFGPYFAPVINLIMFVMLVGVTSVMLSGAGSVFQEQLHLPKMAGILITIIFTLIVLLIGTRGLVWVNTLVVPVLILFSFLLAYLAFHLPDFMGNVAKGFHFTWGAIIDSFAYAAFNISLATAVLVPAATEIGDKKAVKRGGVIGGLALTLILISSHVTLVQLPSLTEFQIPMAVMVNTLATSFHFLFIIVIYGEIFTSVVGNLYGLERFVKRKIPGNTLTIGMAILSVAFAISMVDYGTLLSFLYPLFGYISLVFLLLLIIR